MQASTVWRLDMRVLSEAAPTVLCLQELLFCLGTPDAVRLSVTQALLDKSCVSIYRVILFAPALQQKPLRPVCTLLSQANADCSAPTLYSGHWQDSQAEVRHLEM